MRETLTNLTDKIDLASERLGGAAMAAEQEVLPAGEATHARFHIYPDGGVSRLRLWGRSLPPGSHRP